MKMLDILSLFEWSPDEKSEYLTFLKTKTTTISFISFKGYKGYKEGTNFIEHSSLLEHDKVSVMISVMIISGISWYEDKICKENFLSTSYEEKWLSPAEHSKLHKKKLREEFRIFYRDKKIDTLLCQ